MQRDRQVDVQKQFIDENVFLISQMMVLILKVEQRKKIWMTKRKRMKKKLLPLHVGPDQSWRAGYGASNQTWMNWRNVCLYWLKSSKRWPSSQPPPPFQPWDSSRGLSSWNGISLPWVELCSRRMLKLSGKATTFLCLLWTGKGNNIMKEFWYQLNIKFRLFYFRKV